MNKNNIVYVAGKITGLHNYKEKFERAEKMLTDWGLIVLNPAKLPAGMTHEQYMHICYAYIDVADTVFFLNNWQDSVGAGLEHDYAKRTKKNIMYEENH